MQPPGKIDATRSLISPRLVKKHLRQKEYKTVKSQAPWPAGSLLATPAKRPHHPPPEVNDTQTISIGFLPGTLLLTRRGDCKVETLRPGDGIISRDLGLVSCLAVETHLSTTKAIWFAPGSLGDSRPDCDVILPADQQVLLRDWRAKAIFGKPQALARAASLVDGEFICDLGLRQMTLTVLRFSRPHIIYASGLEVAAARGALSAQSRITAPCA
ncbi:MAG: hypothetical protein ACJARR_000516 [Pseudophaeobacter arcticus]|jgi:hypothetical protein